MGGSSVNVGLTRFRVREVLRAPASERRRYFGREANGKRVRTKRFGASLRGLW